MILQNCEDFQGRKEKKKKHGHRSVHANSTGPAIQGGWEDEGLNYPSKSNRKTSGKRLFVFFHRSPSSLDLHQILC